MSDTTLESGGVDYRGLNHQLLRVVSRTYTLPEEDHETRRLTVWLRQAFRQLMWSKTAGLCSLFEQLREACAGDPGEFERGVWGVVEEATAETLLEVYSAKAGEFTEAFLCLRLRRAAASRIQRHGVREQTLSEWTAGQPRGRGLLEELGRQEEEQILQDRLGASPALAAFADLCSAAATRGLMLDLLWFLQPDGRPDLEDRLGRMVADFEDLRGDPTALPPNPSNGLLLEAWVQDWPEYLNGVMHFCGVYGSGHGRSGSTVRRWLGCLTETICQHLDLCYRDQQGRLLRVWNPALAEAVVAIAHRLSTAASPSPASTRRIEP